MPGDRDRAGFIFAAMEKMGYRVATPGEKDLSFGREFFENLARKHRVKLVSANLYDPVSQELMYPAYATYQVADLKVGVFGVLSPTLAITATGGEATPEAHDAVEAARAVVPELRNREKCDVVLALLHMPNSQCAELLKLVPGIDFAVYGHDSGIRADLEKVEATYVARTGDRGQRIALVDVARGAPGEPPSFTGEVVLLTEGVPMDSLMERSLKAEDEHVKERIGLENARTVAARELERGDDHYIGDTMCARCHQGIVQHWATTAHASAFLRLEDKHESKNPSCVACHVTGFGKATGYEDAHASPDLRNVQCEACHGTGTSHGPGYAKAAWGTCAGCHTPEWSPNFDAKAAWKRIEHPREGTASTAGARG